MQEYDIVIIGGGTAGMVAAIAAKEEGIENIVVIEREDSLGGITNQCIHNGFGLNTFKEDLTGPEFAQRFIDKVKALNIKYKLDTTVLDINREKVITAVSPSEGIIEIKAKSIILAMGCRERPKGLINISSIKGAGIYTAGTVQRFINIEGYLPGKEVVIWGSGDLGLIVARRTCVEGGKVKVLVEKEPYFKAVERNVVHCLEDFNIPYKLKHTIIDIKGKDRVEGVVIAEVDDNSKPIKGTEEFIECDTLILSVDLMPESEMLKKFKISISEATGGPEIDNNMQTDKEGVFACGNLIHIHDLVDEVVMDSYKAGKNAADFIKGKKYKKEEVRVKAGKGISYVIPHWINALEKEEVRIIYRVDNMYDSKNIEIYINEEKELSSYKNRLLPGEAEEIIISREIISKCKKGDNITISIEEA